MTNRQIYIIAYLLNHPQGIKGDHLAYQAGISVRKLQSEIKEINELLPGGAKIGTISKNIYRADGFTEEARKTLLDASDDRNSFYMPEERVNDILSVLLFARDYVTMEYVAETLFLSKATVFRAIENSPALEKAITVNPTRGLLIDVPEFEKRQLLTKVFDKEHAYLYWPGLKEGYEQLSFSFKKILPKLFKEHSYNVSGEALRSFRRYLIITILRRKNGFLLEDIDNKLQVSSLLEDVLQEIYRIEGLQFSPAEIQDCQAKLNELSTFTTQVPPHRNQWKAELEDKYQSFVEEIKKGCGLELSMDEDKRESFMVHVHKLKQRVEFGHHISNYNKRIINRSCPLAVHIILNYFEKSFGFKVPEAEISFLAIYLSLFLQENDKKMRALIVSDMQPSMVYSMRQWLLQHFSSDISDIEIVPKYAFSPDSIEDDILVFTTVEEVVLACQNAILIKPFALDESIEVIGSWIRGMCDSNKQNTFDNSLTRYLSGDIKEVNCSHKHFFEVIDEAEFSKNNGYEFVTDTEVYLLPRFHENESGNNHIEILHLNPPVLHRGGYVRHILVSDYYTETDEIKDFYNCIKILMEPDRIDKIHNED